MICRECNKRLNEMTLICDSCGLEFSIYGVFANCPDCDHLSAITIFKKSIEVIRKKLLLIEDLKDNGSRFKK